MSDLDNLTIVMLRRMDEKLDRILQEIATLSRRVSTLKPDISGSSQTPEEPGHRLDDLMDRFAALSPDERRESVAEANAYLDTEQGRAELGLPPKQRDDAKRSERLEKH